MWHRKRSAIFDQSDLQGAMLPSNVAKDSKSDLQDSKSRALGEVTGRNVKTNVSASYLDILIEKILYDKADRGILNYAFELLKKDTRGTNGYGLKRSWQARQHYQGAFGEAVCKRAKITQDEASSNKVKQVIGEFQGNPAWQAMMKLAVPVCPHFQRVAYAALNHPMLPAHLHKQAKMKPEEFKTTLQDCPKLIQKCYDDIKKTVWNHVWNPKADEGIEIVDSPELFTQCMLELYQCCQVFNVTNSYSKAKEFGSNLQRDEEGKPALEAQYKVQVFKILKDDYKDEQVAYEAFAMDAKSNLQSDEEAKPALESQYKLQVFKILKDNFKDELKAFEAFVKDAKKTPEGQNELRDFWSSLTLMGQNVLCLSVKAEHAEDASA